MSIGVEARGESTRKPADKADLEADIKKIRDARYLQATDKHATYFAPQKHVVEVQESSLIFWLWWFLSSTDQNKIKQLEAVASRDAMQIGLVAQARADMSGVTSFISGSVEHTLHLSALRDDALISERRAQAELVRVARRAKRRAFVFALLIVCAVSVLAFLLKR